MITQLRDKLETFDYSLFLGMICIDESYFLVFVKRVNWRGDLGGHDIFEIGSIKFIAMSVFEAHRSRQRTEEQTSRPSTTSWATSSR